MQHSSLTPAHRADPVLFPLEIPDAVSIPWDDSNASLYGVGIAAINAGLKVFVDPYTGMAIGDRLSVHWDDSGVPFASLVVDASNLNQRLGLALDEKLFVDGDFQVFYRLERPSQADIDSPARTIRVQLSVPGGNDPQPDTSHNENLTAPQIDEALLLNGIDAAQAALGVDITLAAYQNMAEYDRIDFSWGGQRLVHTVQLDEVGQPIVLHVEEATILAAGDGRLILQYEVIDAAANRSDGWSMVTAVDVLAGGTVLDAPIVMPAVNNEIDLAALAGEDVEIEVLATSEHFAVGETVALSWAGRTDAGLSVDWTDTLSITRMPQVLSFFVPNETVAAIAQGNAVVSYTLHKLDGSDLPSRRTQVHIVGAAQALPAPSVREASNGSLDADVAQATVDIAAYAGMTAGDLVTLVWSGTKANGEPTDYRSERVVSGGSVGQTLTFNVPGSAQVEPLAGGQVELWYLVSPAGVLQRALVQESEHLTLSVGAAQVTLPAPTVVEAQNGMLPPDVLQATVEIAPYTGMAAGDRIDLFWKGNLTGEFTDWLPITSTTVGHTLSFTVYPENIASNATAEVSYRVTRAVGGTEPSAILQLRIGEAVPLPAPTIDQANGDQLDPADVPNGATVRVATSANLQAGDLLTVHWAGTAGAGSTDIEHPVTGSQAGKEVTVVVPFSVVEANEGNSIALSYDVLRVAGGSETSPVAVYEVRPETLPLPAPTLDEAQGDQLNPAELLDAAHVSIAASANLQTGDQVTLHWVGLAGIGSYTAQKTVSSGQAGKAMTFLVPIATAAANVGRSITLSYDVRRADTTEGSPSSVYQMLAQTLALPVPVIDEAQGNQLDPDAARSGATVRIVASANLKAGDELNVRWEGLDLAGSYGHVSGVLANEVGEDITRVVPYSVVEAGQGTTINLLYSVVRGSDTGVSPVASYEITDQIAKGRLKVMGARSGLDAQSCYGDRGRQLTALDRETLVPIEAQWQYEGDANIFSGSSFQDSDPSRLLHVRAGDEHVILNLANLCGTRLAMVARLDEGNVIAWGNSDTGGKVPSTIVGMTDIEELIATGEAMAARRANDTVVAWGNAANGGTVPDGINDEFNIIQVAGNRPTYDTGSEVERAFAALRKNGKVVAWGNSSVGGSVPSNIAAMSDIVRIYGGGSAFAALRSTGQVVAWGDSDDGGSVPQEISDIYNIVAVVGNNNAFAARRANGTVVAWGREDHGGTVPSPIDTYNDIIELIPNGVAFAALRTNGKVVAWGSETGGGVLPDAIASLSDIVEVVGTQNGFTARRRNGMVVGWGSLAAPGDIQSLTDIVAITASWGSYAALRSNGQVVAWGNPAIGGDTSGVVGALTEVRAVHAGGRAFAALCEDKRVVTWGDSAAGGNSDDVAALLNGHVSYEATAVSLDSGRRRK